MEDGAFPKADEAAWRALVDRSLKGRNFETLATRAADGFVYGPLYGRMAEAAPLARGDDAPWIIHQRVDDPDPERAGRQARTDLEGGAGGLSLCLAGSLAARGFGLSPNIDAMAKALDGVALDLITLRLEPSRDVTVAAEAIAELAGARNQALDTFAIDLCLDPLGIAAFEGRLPDDVAAVRSATADRFRIWRDMGFAGRLAEADGRIFHDAGATAGQELGAVLAAAVEHLRAFETAGWSVAEAAAAVGFTLAVDQTQFEQMGKLRALRLLWVRVLEACGEAAPPPARIHAETSFRMMAAKDPHTNILRATIAAFAAGAAGADSLAVLPHTAPLGLADPAARRLARNVQIILQEETGLARVMDPATGSGAIETLTELTAEVAWGEFQKIEAEGGLAASLVSGALQSRIADAVIAADHRLEAGQTPIVGTNLYPMKDERIHPLLDADPIVETPTAGGGTPLEPLLSAPPCRQPGDRPMSAIPDFSALAWKRPAAGFASPSETPGSSVRPRASTCRGQASAPTSPGCRISIPIPASPPISAGPIRRCMSRSPGRSGNMPASPRRRSPTPSTGAIWRRGRRACRSPSTSPPIAAMTATIRGSPAMSAWPGSRSTPSSTCANSSTASRSPR